jgi:hypothetical protein
VAAGHLARADTATRAWRDGEAMVPGSPKVPASLLARAHRGAHGIGLGARAAPAHVAPTSHPIIGDCLFLPSAAPRRMPISRRDRGLGAVVLEVLGVGDLDGSSTHSSAEARM